MIHDDTTNSAPDRVPGPLDRRLLLRGGAVLAGAAGVTVIGAAMGSTKANAADGQFMVVGQPNTCESTTAITIGGSVGSDTATMTLTNVSGPGLRLVPTGDGYDGGLKPGEIASTSDGLELGVGADNFPQTTWIATGLDLDEIPFTVPVGPVRLVDTRIPVGRAGIRTTSPDAFDSSFRLNAGAWMDVAIVPSDVVGVDAAFVNVTAVTPLRAGVLTVYPPGDRPTVSTVNFARGQNTANGAFTGTDIASEDPDWSVIRIHSTAATHILVDLTGLTVRGISGNRGVQRGSASQQRAAKKDRMKRVTTV